MEPLEWRRHSFHIRLDNTWRTKNLRKWGLCLAIVTVTVASARTKAVKYPKFIYSAFLLLFSRLIAVYLLGNLFWDINAFFSGGLLGGLFGDIFALLSGNVGASGLVGSVDTLALLLIGSGTLLLIGGLIGGLILGRALLNWKSIASW